MGGKSSIAQLPEPVRVEVDAAIKRGATIDEIVWMLKGLGADVSRSAVGRYSKQYAAIASRQRDMASVAQAFGAEFGDPNDRQIRLLIQLFTTVTTRAIMPIAAGDEVTLDGKELHYFARALKDVADAAKSDVDREAKLLARARQQAAKDAESEGRAAGATEETIDRIKRRILGIAAPAPAEGGGKA